MKPSSLLTYLAIHCRVEFISDLTLTPQCKEVIAKIKDNAFSLDEWNDVVHYLCKVKDITFTSEKSAKEFLIKNN